MSNLGVPGGLFDLAHSLPKIELHAHIGGCIRQSTFQELAKQKGIRTDHIDFDNVTIPEGSFAIFSITN